MQLAQNCGYHILTETSSYGTLYSNTKVQCVHHYEGNKKFSKALFFCCWDGVDRTLINVRPNFVRHTPQFPASYMYTIPQG